MNVPVFVPIKITKAPTKNFVSACYSGAEGQNRTADTGIFRPNFGKSGNTVIPGG